MKSRAQVVFLNKGKGVIYFMPNRSVIHHLKIGGSHGASFFNQRSL